VKILIALLTALALPTAPAPPSPAQGAPADEAPDCSVELTLPQTALDLRLDYRQVGPDLSRFREPEGATAADVDKLRVLAHLALGASLSSDVWLTIGDRTLKPGKRPLGFTLGHDEAMHLFLVDGSQAFPLVSEFVEPGFESPRLLLQLRYVSRSEARLLWHWKKAAGSIRLGLGTPEAAAAPAPAPAPQPAGR
jgi:hypothetical protein